MVLDQCLVWGVLTRIEVIISYYFVNELHKKINHCLICVKSWMSLFHQLETVCIVFFLSSIHVPEVNLLPKVGNFCRCLIRYCEHKPWTHLFNLHWFISLAMEDLVNKQNCICF